MVDHVVTGSKGSDVLHIRYSQGDTGALVRADFQTLFGNTARVGQRIEIDYDPAD